MDRLESSSKSPLSPWNSSQRRKSTFEANRVDEPQDIFLRYKSKDVEKSYLQYLHPRPFKSVCAVYLCLLVLYIVFLLGASDSGFEPMVGWFAAIAIGQLVLFFMFPRKQHLAAELLLVERVMMLCSTVWTASIDHVATLRHFQSCDYYPQVVLDDRVYFKDPQCHRWLNSGGALAAAVLALLGFLPFTYLLFHCGAMMVVYLVLWVLIPPPDLAYQVGMLAAYNFIGMSFVLLFKYDQESTHRGLFLKFRNLQQQRERLSVREKGLARYCAVLFPEALLQRSSGDLNVVDNATSAAMLMIGFHDFALWCTQRQPVDAAGDVVDLLIAVRKAAKVQKVNFIGSMGDTAVCTSGLIQPRLDPEFAIAHVAYSVMCREGTDVTQAPLRMAMHSGHLRGAFVGQRSVRYDVSGPCYVKAESAFLNCPKDRCVAPPNMAAKATSFALFVEDDTVDAVVGEAQFSVLVPMAAPVDLNGPSVDVALNPEDPLSWAPDDDVDAAFHKMVMNLTGGVEPQPPKKAFHDNNEDGDEDMFVGDGTGDSTEPSISGLNEQLLLLQDTKTVWCCFPRFVNTDLEISFISERIDQLPLAASRMWFAYSFFIVGVLTLLLIDLKEPHGVISVFMLLGAAGFAVILGTLPRVLEREQMRKKFFAWSVMGVTLPLLVVYACAVSRPSAVGNDPKMLMVVGALVRSYCFTTTRWLALAVPITTLMAIGQYAMDGAYLRTTLVIPIGLMIGLVAAEREREIQYRNNTRRTVESRLIVSKLREVERLREGLVRTAVPAAVFALMREHHETGSLSTVSTAIQADGAVMVISRVPKVASPAISLGTSMTGSAETAPNSGNSTLLRLEELLAETETLALGGILGEQAIVVGPVVTSRRTRTCGRSEASLIDAITLAVKLTSESESAGDDGTLSVVTDYDAIVHAVELGDFAQYRALGVTVTRMLTIVRAADPATLVGCLVTERVTNMAEELRLLPAYQTTQLGPMKFRGAGLVRFTRIEGRLSGTATPSSMGYLSSDLSPYAGN